MHFPYREIEPGKFAPIVDVRLFGRNRIFSFEAFIDSGADFSVFDIQSAELLGVDYKKGEKLPITVGDGDRMVCYLHHLPVLFAGEKFLTPLCFSKTLGAGFNLMGRAGFFEKFRICFHERSKFVSVVRV